MRRFALVFVLGACSPPAVPPELAEPLVVAPPPAGAAREPSAAPPPPAIEGGSECDAYLELYEKCEPKLAPSIAAGDRRSFRSEQAWVEHMRTTSEAPGMPEACKTLLAELHKACDP